MINMRILGMVACYLIVAGLSVATVKLASRPAVWVEHILPRGQASLSRAPYGLRIAVRGNHLEISLPYCSTALFPEPFFVHVYPSWVGDGPEAKPIVTEFILADRTPRWTKKDGVTFCNYSESFKGKNPQEIIVGQSKKNTDGSCCTILWSRSYFPVAK